MRRVIYHPFVAIIITVIGIIFFISLDNTAKKTEISSKNIEILENEVGSMSAEVIGLEEKIIETQTDIFREKVIRNELLLQKPNEQIVQLPNLENIEKPDEKIEEESRPIDEWIELLKF